jgi:Ca-activated chloride channel family protein
MRYALMRYTVMLALLAIALPAEANSNWERLWFNADQRGEKLLQDGDANAAARVYKDPRRRAYAEMKAGDYRQAASELDKLHDSDSDYNRGNALAKMGNLNGALDAYDAALKRNPKNHDAQHNRDLVEKALQQQKQNKRQNGKQQDNKSGGKQGSNSVGPGSQSGKNTNGANGKNGQQSAGKNSAQSGKSGGKPTDENSAGQKNAQTGANQNPGASGNQAQQNPGQSGEEQQGRDANAAAQSGKVRNASEAGRQQAAKPGNPSANGQSTSDQSADEAAQARQDAQAGLAAKNSGMTGNRIANAAPSDQTAPLSEQQLSREQWLRNIPDDPGGLLRRKFMIEYMLRQQKAQQ